MKTATPTPESPEATFSNAFRLFKPSIEIIKRNLLGILLFVVVPVALVGLGTFMAHMHGDTDPAAPFKGIYGVLFLLANLITLLTLPAVLLIQLHGARGQTISPDDALSQGIRFLPRLIGLLICMAVIFAVSFVLLIVPFFFMLRRYILAPYYLVDQHLGIFDALKASAADSKIYSSPLWGLIGVEVVIALAVLIPGAAGQLVSNIGSLLYVAAPAVRYEQIQAAKSGKKPLAPIEAA